MTISCLLWCYRQQGDQQVQLKDERLQDIHQRLQSSRIEMDEERHQWKIKVGTYAHKYCGILIKYLTREYVVMCNEKLQKYESIIARFNSDNN